ncbi:MAG: OmpA family protein [Hyphomonas sp.]
MKTAIHKHAAAGLAAIALAMPAFAQVPPAPPVEAPQPVAPICDDMKLDIYFSAYETALTPQSASVIEAASEHLKGCYVAAVSLDVLSEEAHTDEEAADLSEARANTVISALIEKGVEPLAFEADFRRVDAAAPGAAPMVEPMARRVSVSFEVRNRFGTI